MSSTMCIFGETDRYFSNEKKKFFIASMSSYSVEKIYSHK